MNRLLLLTCALIATGLVAASCGGDDDSSSDGESAADTATESTDAAPAEEATTDEAPPAEAAGPVDPDAFAECLNGEGEKDAEITNTDTDSALIDAAGETLRTSYIVGASQIISASTRNIASIELAAYSDDAAATEAADVAVTEVPPDNVLQVGSVVVAADPSGHKALEACL